MNYTERRTLRAKEKSGSADLQMATLGKIKRRGLQAGIKKLCF
jgi:hypothetical protein